MLLCNSCDYHCSETASANVSGAEKCEESLEGKVLASCIAEPLSPLNTKVARVIQDEDIVLRDRHGVETGEVQTLEILQAMGTGSTSYSLSLMWGGIEVKRVSFSLFVNQVY